MNPYKALISLLPGESIQVGTVTRVDTDSVQVQLQSGFYLKAYGTASLGARVRLRGSAIIGTAPSLPGTALEV